MKINKIHQKIMTFVSLQIILFSQSIETVLAQSRIDNPVINPGIRAGSGAGALQIFISAFVGVLTVVGAFIFLYMIITGATQFITSEGDKNAYETARKKITMGVVGLVILIAAIFIAEVVATFLGVPEIFDLPTMINTISNTVGS